MNLKNYKELFTEISQNWQTLVEDYKEDFDSEATIIRTCLLYSYAKKYGAPMENFSKLRSLEKKVWECLWDSEALPELLYVDSESVLSNDNDEDMEFEILYSLAEQFFMAELITIDQFRSIIREFFYKEKGEDSYRFIIRSALMWLQQRQNSNIVDINDIKLWFDYLGIRIFSLSMILNHAAQYGVEINTDNLPIHEIDDLNANYEHISDFFYEKEDFMDWEQKYFDWLYPETQEALVERAIELVKETIKKQLEENYSNKRLSMYRYRSFLRKIIADFPVPIPISHKNLVLPFSSYLEPQPINADSLKKLSAYQLKYLLPKKVYKFPIRSTDVKVVFLSGTEIGRSGILIKTPNAKVLLDYGLSVASFRHPEYDPNLLDLDAVLISHTHLDHVGALPLLFRKPQDFRWYATKTTKHLAMLLLRDNKKILQRNIKHDIINKNATLNGLTRQQLLTATEDHFLQLSQKPVEVAPGVIVKSHSAAHIPGSVSFEILLEDVGKTLIYTGDFKLDKTHIFPKGATLPTDIDLLMFDGTYFGREKKEHFEATPEDVINMALNACNKAVFPAFATGRAQEILLTLDSLGWTKEFTVYLDGIAAKITQLMDLKAKYKIPTDSHSFELQEGEIVISGSGMLSGGLAKRLVMQTRKDPQTAVIFTGWLAPSTLAYALESQHPQIAPHFQQKFYHARFSGHTLPSTLYDYLDRTSAKKVGIHIGHLSVPPFEIKQRKKELKKKVKEHNVILPELGKEYSFLKE